ncbi:unnamed protein product [Arctia plantaginis]|uniref:Vitellogenin n=1 Tax=Arctia plantaginis TaxID=874455 RepID=A0A8S1BJV6_ARCPL|nr:unnamed protein product [Arctia plantaginis]
MKLLVLAAFIAVVSSGRLSKQQPESQQEFAWQTGKQYRYDVNSHTLTRIHEGTSPGSAFKAHFIIRVKSPGHLQAKLEEPQYAQFHQNLRNKIFLPDDLKYKSVQNLDKPFEIIVEGGRFQSMNLPSSFSVAHENLLKGLISALQVDLSSHRHLHSTDNFDKERQQGLFRKFETDVTGDCETLYSVSPVAADWRRELPQFASEEDPMEISKSRHYGNCHHRVAYHFGVPEGAEWTGTAHKTNERQFISHSSVARMLVGKQGPIYKAETTSYVHVHPHVYGKQKAEVHSHVKLALVSIERDNDVEWQKPEGHRQVTTLLFAMTTKQHNIHGLSPSPLQSSEESHESNEHTKVSFEESQNEAQRSESSSSSDSSSTYRNDDMPNINEPVYAAMYLDSESHSDKKQNPMNAQKLLLDMAQQLQNPNNLPKADFLSKFNILVRVIALMSSEQLAQTSHSIEVAKTSNNFVKADMWMIYRDAMIQCGTPPSFQQFIKWVKSKKIHGEEAAQAVASLAKTLRYPTKEIMTQFFDLAMSPEVQEQNFFNSSALIAATTFIRLGQVNNETARNYYPSQMYGRLAPVHDRFVLDYVLPQLSEKLKHALQKDERSKAMLYIKAIGNLGHREILQVFAPYLEGHYQVSTYLRVQMISELRFLVDQNDKYIRDVLYTIMRNTAEAYEVRVAAVLNMFRANPTTVMMQVMAEMTIHDPSIHVRAALKYGIETAANLKDPRYWNLSKSAQAVKDLVTPDDLGVWYSNAVFFDNYDSNEYENDPYFREISYIGSEDGAAPKKERLTWRYKIGGLAAENNVDWSFSSAKDFADYIKQMIFEPRKSDALHRYSAKKISEMLNIKHNKPDELESSFYIETLNHERFLALDAVDLKKLALDVGEYFKEMEKGVEMRYTKVFNAKQISVMFPIATGVPFIYKYKEPVLVHIYSKASGKINNDKKDVSAKMNKEVMFTVAANVDGSVGFTDTFSNQLASAGVVKKYQLNVPIKMTIEAKSGEFKMRAEPLRPNQDTTIVHFSMWPYSTIQKKDSLTPISQDPSTKLVQRPKKVSNTDFKFGQEIGNIFHIQGYSFSKNFRHANNPLQALFNIGDFLKINDLAQTHYNIRYLGKQSKNKAMTFTAVYDEYYNQQQGGEFGQAKKTNDFKANSKARREEMAKQVSLGLHTAEASVLDLSARFEGSQEEEYLLTAAFSYSPVQRKNQAAIFLGRTSVQHGHEQINAIVKVHNPELTPLNFFESLKNNKEATFEIDVMCGLNGNIHIQSNSERSQKYTQQLKRHPMAHECGQEMNKNNQYQLACHKMLVRSHAPDHIKTSVTYKNLSPEFLYIASQAYEILEPLNADPNPLNKVADGKLELEAEASYNANSLSFNMTSSKGILRFENVPIPDFAPYLMSSYSPFSAMSGFEHFANFKTNDRYQPFCTVDGVKVKTFSSRSYEYELSRSWHVVMQQEDCKERGKWDELVILSRRPSAKQQQVYISHKTETGHDLEIDIHPSAANNKADVKVKTNGKKISDGNLTTYWDDAAEAPLLQYYIHPDGVLLLNIRNGHLRIMFDGQRLVVSTSEYRKSTRGICGRNTGEPRDDFETPKGLVDQPEYYGASYSLDDESSDPKTQEWKKEAQKNAYQAKTKYTKILRSASEWKQPWGKHEENKSVYRTRCYDKQRGKCQVHQQVQYHENHREICITNTPLDSCQSHCRGENYHVKSVQVICKSKSDKQFKLYKDQIKQGQSPKVSGVTKQEQYRVPTSCKP